jgi:sugar/nucleoside kinase (ribokinase family)
MLNRIKAVIIGDVCCDINNPESGIEYKSPGGPPIFCLKLFSSLGVTTLISTSRGSDFPEKAFGNARIYPEKADCTKTMIFKNLQSKNTRTQKMVITECPKMVKLSELPDEFIKNVDIVIVAPLYNNYSLVELKKIKKYYPKSMKMLLPQGFFRKMDKGGNVSKRKWIEAKKTLSSFDVVILSEKDGDNLDHFASLWSRNERIIVITRGEKGSSIYKKGKRLDEKAFLVPENKILDSTGAGDIFAAAFAYYYFLFKDSDKASVFANGAAAMSLLKSQDELKYNMRAIKEYIIKTPRRET